MAELPAVGPHAGEAEYGRYKQIVGEAFTTLADRCDAYLKLAGPANIRVVRAGGQVAGGLVSLPAGQWFGGRSVPTGAIAAVAVAPEFRARGIATQLLRGVLEELHAAGTPLSTLYPATVQLYRRVGYEQAGFSCEISVPLRLIDLRDRGLEVRAARADDIEAIRAVYRQWVARFSGGLDRTGFFWHRLHHPRGENARVYVVCADKRVEGYALVWDQKSDERYNLRVEDLAALTPAAARRLLAFFADHRTVRENVVWRSGPSDPLLGLLAEDRYQIRGLSPWMLRIIDVRGALETRAYPAGVGAEVHLVIRDDVLPENDDRYVLIVKDGRGRVERGGRGAVEIDVRGLAALYSGYRSRAELALAGQLAGPEGELAGLDAVFAGPIPWMRDDF